MLVTLAAFPVCFCYAVVGREGTGVVNKGGMDGRACWMIGRRLLPGLALGGVVVVDGGDGGGGGRGSSGSGGDGGGLRLLVVVMDIGMQHPLMVVVMCLRP